MWKRALIMLIAYAASVFMEYLNMIYFKYFYSEEKPNRSDIPKVLLGALLFVFPLTLAMFLED